MKKTFFIVVVVIAAMIGALVLGSIGTYNGLVGKQQAVDAAWAQVANQYQRRADLIPNLVSTVKGSADFEKSTLESVIEARASVGKVNVDMSNAPESAAMLEKFQDAQNQFGSALQRLLVTVERYPDLKASAGFRDLQAQLEGAENRIAVERGRFNEVSKVYNTAIKKVPAVFFASMLGFDSKPYFENEAGTEKAPEVDFDFGNKGSDAE
ncbi:LemA family protein [Haloferula sp.]|uniref:LemA family protein n=1 Tax=Haloferula sp. TaxID=2497595 RepID=UPI003C733BB2